MDNFARIVIGQKLLQSSPSQMFSGVLLRLKGYTEIGISSQNDFYHRDLDLSLWIMIQFQL